MFRRKGGFTGMDNIVARLLALKAEERELYAIMRARELQRVREAGMVEVIQKQRAPREVDEQLARLIKG